MTTTPIRTDGWATESNVSFLIEWVRGPRETTYPAWRKDLEQRFPPVRFSGSADDDAQARRRVDRLLSNLKELARVAPLDWRAGKVLADQINRAFARYRSTPYLGYDRPLRWKIKVRAGRYIVPKSPQPAPGGVFFWTTAPDRSTAPAQELRAVRLVETIVQNGWLNTLRRCQQCSKWLSAKKPWTKLCGARACRDNYKRAYQKSEAYKASRRKNPA